LKDTKKVSETNWNNAIDALADVKNYIYILLVSTVYILVLHNKYYDITKTRYTWFVGISCLFIVTSLLVALISCTLGGVHAGDFIKSVRGNFPLAMLGVFLLANVVACFMGQSLETRGQDGTMSMHAFYGDNGRFMGLAMYIILCLVAGILAKNYRGFDSLYVVFAAVILFTLIMALVQHTGVDVFSLKDGIKSGQYDKFISTMGNINIFASYMVIVIGVAFGAYIYGCSKIPFKVLYAVVLFVCGMTIMTANSDSAYLGLGVILFAGVLTGVYNGKLKELLEAGMIFFAGNLLTAIWHTQMESYPDYGGIAHKLDDVKVAAVPVIGFALLYAVTIAVKKYSKREFRKNLFVPVFVACAVIAVCVFVVYGIKSGDSLFKFDYKWGTYRGYIWSRCWETFKEAPLVNKLFGYGNESIRQVVTTPNYNDMIEKTNRIYDNAHNEVLQYLLTLGIFGALSYIALFVSAIWYMCRYGAKTMHTYIPVFVVCGYFTQGLVNLNQPITTPLFFVFLGMGVGYAAYSKNN
jgi:hypothetical protein